MTKFILSACALGAGLLAACSTPTSATDLHPEGPPIVRQVIMTERVTRSNGSVVAVPALAFGHHPDFDPEDDGVVSNATVQGNSIRVIVDEILLGNTLEQIGCRPRGPTNVDDPNDMLNLPPTFQSVPEGTTPDDIVACADQDDVIPQTCHGDHAVCFAPEGTTCPDQYKNVDGKCPTGVLDYDHDGAADDTAFMPGAVHIKCGNIDVPLKLNNSSGSAASSYWQPAGNQQVPAAGGFNSVGPAVVLYPLNGMPTSQTACTITFDSSVTDKDHINVCASGTAGQIDTYGDEDQPCTPGDTSLIKWGTEELKVNGTNPPNNATNVTHTGADQKILVQFNAPVSNSSAQNAFTLMEGNTQRTDITVAVDPMNNANVNITVPGGFVAATTYTLTVGTAITDQFGVNLPADQVATITWTTAN